MTPPPTIVKEYSNNMEGQKGGNTTVRRRGPSSPVNEDIGSGTAPRTLTSRRWPESSLSGSGVSESKGPKGALFGASGNSLLESEVRRDYVLADGQSADFGKPLGDSYLTLMDEVVLLGLKDQQVRFPQDFRSYAFDRDICRS
jgi:hypothetical protein